jgi:hypothetical protein
MSRRADLSSSPCRRLGSSRRAPPAGAGRRDGQPTAWLAYLRGERAQRLARPISPARVLTGRSVCLSAS